MNRVKTELTIPCHWDKAVLDDICTMNDMPENHGVRVVSMYCAIPNNTFGSGRSPNSIANVSRDEAVEFRNYVRGKNLHFNY